jgi:transcriptional regulator with XRE-family HTH domain
VLSLFKIRIRLEANVIPTSPDNPFPHADSPAARTLQSALKRAKEENKTSLRAIAKLLNYKQAAVLSHMANGRIPIPVERAQEIATVLDINPHAFMKLVLKQRYPNMPISEEDDVTNHFALLSELNQPRLPVGLSNATPSQMRIIREVLRDDHASERWLSPHEVFFVNVIRKLRPEVVTDGLSSSDLQLLNFALGPLTELPEMDH